MSVRDTALTGRFTRVAVAVWLLVLQIHMKMKATGLLYLEIRDLEIRDQEGTRWIFD